MSNFFTPLRLEYLDGRRWQLLEPFGYRVDGARDSIRVPKGFVTDFASIPRWLWWLYPPTGRWGRAAVLHDWLYCKATRPRKACDDVFLEAMRVLGVPWHRRYLMFLAVRLFGGRAYHRRDSR